MRPLDEALMTVLGIQPSEIDHLDMADDYWFWVDVAAAKVKRENDALSRQ